MKSHGWFFAPKQELEFGGKIEAVPDVEVAVKVPLLWLISLDSIAIWHYYLAINSKLEEGY